MLVMKYSKGLEEAQTIVLSLIPSTLYYDYYFTTN